MTTQPVVIRDARYTGTWKKYRGVKTDGIIFRKLDKHGGTPSGGIDGQYISRMAQFILHFFFKINLQSVAEYALLSYRCWTTLSEGMNSAMLQPRVRVSFQLSFLLFLIFLEELTWNTAVYRYRGIPRYVVTGPSGTAMAHPETVEKNVHCYRNWRRVFARLVFTGVLTYRFYVV